MICSSDSISNTFASFISNSISSQSSMNKGTNIKKIFLVKLNRRKKKQSKIVKKKKQLKEGKRRIKKEGNHRPDSMKKPMTRPDDYPFGRVST